MCKIVVLQNKMLEYNNKYNEPVVLHVINTCHGMGMIAAVTPAVKNANVILRAKVKPSDVAAMGKIPILFCRNEAFD